MAKKLRIKFVIYAISAITLVLVSLVSFVSISNYLNIINDSDIFLKVMIENDGEFTQSSQIHSESESEEIQFFNVFFAFKLTDDNELIEAKLDQSLFNLDQAEVENILEDIDLDVEKGYYEDFRYMVVEKDYGKIVVFLDNSKELSHFNNTLRTSILYSVFGILACLIVLVIFSKKAVAPIVENYEKQKQFITDASHELKTPLAIIRSSAEVIEMQDSKSKWTKNIIGQTSRLSELINGLVSLVKLEEEIVKPSNSQFNFSDIVNNVVNEFRDIADEKQIMIISNIEHNLKYDGDEEDIKKIFSILFENALKYGKNQINLDVRKKASKIKIEFSNQADNLEIKNYNILMERFYRLDESRNSQTGGYGIGLSIVNSIVNKYHGNINIESKDGATLYFHIALIAL
ncbi:MAG: sensor histidine kinase [Bacilli bacterium]